ncbi:MAG TPA: lipase maturation factor family protein [Myxococcales bacterium]|nr:lipase maturation factor family protein [Myxococcales bacterium]
MLWPRWIWLRALGLIFLSAFYSLAFQITGLIGPRGVLPAGSWLTGFSARALWESPTIFWISASDHALLAVVALGALASMLLVLNVLPRLSLAVAWICFLSFVAAAQVFASYQSDGMLLEAGFISLFLAPGGLRPGLAADAPPSRFSIFMLKWEWFRIYFESGVVKLLSGDVQWRTLTAMDHYYENGPLPSYLGWYMQQELPHWFHAGSVIVVFVLELALPFLAFLPRRFRRFCFYCVTPFQALIILTANYAFLNYIVLFLGIFLLDDAVFRREPAAPGRASLFQRAVLGVLLFVGISAAPRVRQLLPGALLLPAQALEPFRIANRYGLFAVMTENRFEIEFQGSNDGMTYVAYPFRYKPQELRAAPGLFAPYQPRFEWNLWFASLSDVAADPWVINAAVRLLQGSPPVLRLFREDPFRGKPPRYLRTVLWQYWFTSPAERRRTGAWWKRERRGNYGPELELVSGEVRAR